MLRPWTLHKSRHLSVPGLHMAKKLLPPNSPKMPMSRGLRGIAPGEPSSAVHALSSLASAPACHKARLLPTALGERDWGWSVCWISGFLQPLETTEMERFLHGWGLQIAFLMTHPVA